LQGFYKRLGFQVIRNPPGWLAAEAAIGQIVSRALGNSDGLVVMMWQK